MSQESSDFLRPKESGKFIVEGCKDVSIVEEGIDFTADKIYDALRAGKLGLKNFKQWELHPQDPNEFAIDWIFLADTLNFSFWSGDPVSSSSLVGPVPKWQVAYKGKSYTGYFALCAGINRALDEGLDIVNPTVFGSLKEEDILHIFRSETSTPIPMVSDRLKNLQEASKVLVGKYHGSFVNCVKQAGQSAQTLLNQIVADFSSYRDENTFKGKRVSFWKRAQILIGDVWVCFEGKGLGYFRDIDTLTMFADYRIPQVLLHFGALKYSSELNSLLEKDKIISNGDRLEIEIRGASIHAVELIKDRVVKKCLEENDENAKLAISENPINSIMIDHFLWDYRREYVKELDKFPYHKVRCIYY